MTNQRRDDLDAPPTEIANVYDKRSWRSGRVKESERGKLSWRGVRRTIFQFFTFSLFCTGRKN